MNTHSSYSGSQKAAILLLSFGEEISSEIFKNLNEFEIKRIGTAMSRLGRLEQEVVDQIIIEFYEILQKNKQFFYGGADYTKKIIGSAFTGTEAEQLLGQLSLPSATLDALDLIDSRTLAGIIRNEHPQTMALILAHLDPMKFGETIRLLPESLHTDILLRVANLESVAPELIDEIDDVLRAEVQSMGALTTDKIGGVESVANMLNLIDKATEEEMLGNLEERDPDLAEEIRQLMFVFDDLASLDDRSIQEVIKNIPNDKWMVALKSASDSVKVLIFKNMSQRAAEMLKEDMEAMPAVKLSDVEAAQYEVLQVTRKLEEEGKIAINRGGESAYV